MSSGPNCRRKGWTGNPVHYPRNSSGGKLSMIVTLQKNLSQSTKRKTYKTVLTEPKVLHASSHTFISDRKNGLQKETPINKVT